jgi:hypothetical protein
MMDALMEAFRCLKLTVIFKDCCLSMKKNKKVTLS